MRLITLTLLTVAGGLLVGCTSSSNGDQDASADTTPPDGTADVGADGSSEAGADGGSVEAGSQCTSNADCDLARDLLCGFATDAGERGRCLH